MGKIQLRDVLESPLNAQDKCTIIYFDLISNDKGEVSITLTEACKKLKITKPTFIKSVNSLEKSRHLIIKKTFSKTIGQLPNTYVLISKNLKNG